MYRASHKQTEESHKGRETVESSWEEETRRRARDGAKTRGMPKTGSGFKRPFIRTLRESRHARVSTTAKARVLATTPGVTLSTASAATHDAASTTAQAQQRQVPGHWLRSTGSAD